MPSGYYFFSAYRLSCGNCLHVLLPTPSSAKDVFEIALGVINYVGDWRSDLNHMGDWRSDGRPDIDISYNASTLERLLNNYPEAAEKYDVYLSIMGKRAISMDGMAHLTNKEQDPSIE